MALHRVAERSTRALARCLMAFRYQEKNSAGHPTIYAHVGARFEAEQLTLIRGFLTGKSGSLLDPD